MPAVGMELLDGMRAAMWQASAGAGKPALGSPWPRSWRMAFVRLLRPLLSRLAPTARLVVTVVALPLLIGGVLEQLGALLVVWLQDLFLSLDSDAHPVGLHSAAAAASAAEGAPRAPALRELVRCPPGEHGGRGTRPAAAAETRLQHSGPGLQLCPSAILLGIAAFTRCEAFAAVAEGESRAS
mmetsp:Transcript_60225/g.195480  ORF Transcript_60225/g.195480 Transcript_60225/m.195480 type:complete len:183 (+) Transcript_60225:65-613(+)